MQPEWKKKRFSDFVLYGVTDLTEEDSGIEEKIDAACRGGADIIQLRSKNLSDAVLYRMGQKVRQVTRHHEVLFFVNDRVDLALALDADGVHVGQDDMPVPVIREICRGAGKQLLLGKSTHSLEQAVSTAAEDVDYIGVGPVFGTPTKPGYKPVGPELISEVKNAVAVCGAWRY